MAETEKLTQPASPDAKPVKKADGITLPVLVEFVFTFSAILLILMFLTMTVISWLTGATLLDFVLRTSVSMLVLGSLLTLISWQISMGVFSASTARQPEVPEQELSEKIASPENFEKQSIPEVP
jgi:hypothetical protein